MKTPDLPHFSTARGRRLRFGSAPLGADQRLRERTGQLATELDRISAALKAKDVSPSEARAQSSAAIASYRKATAAIADGLAPVRARVAAAGEVLQDRVSARLGKLTAYELVRIQRRAAQIEASAIPFDAAAAVEARDVEGLLALGLSSPAAGNRAMAALFATDSANQLVASATELRALAAAEQALVACDELALLGDVLSDRHVATGLDLASETTVATSIFAPPTWPRWAASFLDIEPPPAPAAPPAEAARTAGGAA